VLDPACGSGNFLYVALRGLMALEHELIRAAARWRATVPAPRVGPEQIYGLELDDYAAELASLTVWIGYLQFRYAHNRGRHETPILRRLDTIRRMDAILAPDGSEPEWPEVDVIVGNPPFLGGKKLRAELGDAYVDRVFKLYQGRVPREADLCCYWFEKARAAIAAGRARRAGLLATNSIRQGPQMRPVLQRIADTGGIFMAWSDRPWVLDGAAVRISMVGFDDGTQTERTLDGQPVATINPDLTSGLDLSQAKRLTENLGIAFMGDTKGGAFDIPGTLARSWLKAPNPLNRCNADVLKPWYNGLDVTRRPRDMWIIDFGVDMPETEAALYELPFEYVTHQVKPERLKNNRAAYRERWWLHVEPRRGMRLAFAPLSRYIATPQVARHRVFAWLPVEVLPDHKLIVFARDDDYFFGVLHSRVHELWSLRTCSWQGAGNDPVYTPTTCFETFPFPEPDEAQREAIAKAAKALHETRQSALDANPKLTLTALYNQRPTWLANLHADLDAAVLAAYGWPADIGDEALLAGLLALNLARAGGG
jgi:type II restriction/modification system DNA methylase subunit YeeA